MKIRVGKGEISVIQGDIADQDTDAIVNAANNEKELKHRFTAQNH